MEKRILEGHHGVYRLSGLHERLPSGNVYQAYKVTASLFDEREQYAAREVFLQFDSIHAQRAAVDAHTERAARLLKLSHPGLIRVADFVLHGLYHYTMFEFQPGTRLELLLERQRGASSEELVLHLAADLVAGLRYLHSQGLVFGDLSPTAVLVTPQGRARLTDFSLPAYVQAARAAYPLSGTPGYAAPEQAQGATVQSDLHALGAVLWRCLALRNPADAARPLPPVRRFNRHVSSWMETLIVRLTDADLARRFQNAEEVWRVLCEHEPSLESEPPTGTWGGLLARILGKIGRRGGA